jgi:alpha-L-fucosidase
VLDLREDIETSGQQVESFAVDMLIKGSWTLVAEGTTIGHRRLLTLDDPITVDDVRLRVLSTRGQSAVDVTVDNDPILSRTPPPP